MTTNVRNQGIAHLAFKAGARPLCQTRKGHIVVAIADSASWGDICKRCAGKLVKMQEATARKAVA